MEVNYDLLDKMSMPELEQEKKKFQNEFDKIQKESVKELKEDVGEINNRLGYLLDDITKLKSSSGDLRNVIKQNKLKHKKAFEEIKKLLDKIEEMAIEGALDQLATDMNKIDDTIMEKSSKKASISSFIGLLGKKLFD